MAKLSLNSIPNSVFKVNASDVADNNATRASIVSAGRLLTSEYAKKGVNAMHNALHTNATASAAILSRGYSPCGRRIRRTGSMASWRRRRRYGSRALSGT